MSLSVTQFDGYFGLFAAANLAWAGSQHFRNAVDSQVLSPSIKEQNDLISKENKIKFDTEKKIKNIEFQKAIIYQITSILEEMQSRIGALVKEKEEADSRFVVKYKSMFLFTSIYILIVLVLGGFQSVIEEQLFSDLLLTLNLGIFYNIYIYVTAHRLNSKKYDPVRVPIIIIFLLIVTLLITSVCSPLFATVNLNQELLFGLIVSLINVFTPFVFHYVRAYLNFKKYTSRISNQILAAERKIDKLSSASETLSEILKFE